MDKIGTNKGNMVEKGIHTMVQKKFGQFTTGGWFGNPAQGYGGNHEQCYGGNFGNPAQGYGGNFGNHEQCYR